MAGFNNFPKVAVVIPNKNGMFHLSYSLPSILATDYQNFRVILADDRSSDRSVETSKAGFSDVKVLSNEGKRGFAATVNVGILSALGDKSEIVVVANSDIRVPKWWLKSAILVLNENENVGILGFKEILRGSGGLPQAQLSSVKIHESVAIPGCLFAVRKDVFRKVGLFDEDYFMYGEDNDFFCRVKKAGFVVISSDIPVWHYGEGSSVNKRVFPSWMAYRNALRCSMKNFGFWGAAKMVAALFYQGCIPHLSEYPSDPSRQRLRRYNPVVNMALLVGSIGWNIWNLPKTVMARRQTGTGTVSAVCGQAPAKALRVAMLNLTGGGISGGYRKYFTNIVPRIAASERISSILCAAPKNLSIKSLLPQIEKVSITTCETFRPFIHSPGPVLKAALDQFVPDILFVPIERYVNYEGRPVVVMLQNMAPISGVKTGAGVKERLLSFFRRYETRYALNHASAVVVPTAYVRNFLIERERINPAKLFVIHYGNSTVQATVPPREGLNLTKFIFTAGSLEMYRGVEDLIRVLPGILSRFPGIKLVVAGGTRPTTKEYAVTLKRLAVSLGVSEDILWLGNISEAELSWYYSNCLAFVLTSRVESFCFIALEAMSHGCACVSSSSACLPEILRDTALYYSPGDIAALNEAILKVLSRKADEIASNRNMALKRAAEFSWDVTASDTVGVFARAVGNCKNT